MRLKGKNRIFTEHVKKSKMVKSVYESDYILQNKRCLMHGFFCHTKTQFEDLYKITNIIEWNYCIS